MISLGYAAITSIPLALIGAIIPLAFYEVAKGLKNKSMIEACLQFDDIVKKI